MRKITIILMLLVVSLSLTNSINAQTLPPTPGSAFTCIGPCVGHYDAHCIYKNLNSRFPRQWPFRIYGGKCECVEPLFLPTDMWYCYGRIEVNEGYKEAIIRENCPPERVFDGEIYYYDSAYVAENEGASFDGPFDLKCKPLLRNLAPVLGVVLVLCGAAGLLGPTTALICRWLILK